MKIIDGNIKFPEILQPYLQVWVYLTLTTHQLVINRLRETSPCSEYTKCRGDVDNKQCPGERSSNWPEIQNSMQMQCLQLITHTQTNTTIFLQYEKQTPHICVRNNSNQLFYITQVTIMTTMITTATICTLPSWHNIVTSYMVDVWQMNWSKI